MTKTTHIAETIRGRRRLLGWTQQDLADQAGVSRELLGRVEGGSGSVSLERLQAICRALGLELAALDSSRASGPTGAGGPVRRR